MDLTGIIAISGKGGLFTVVGQSKNSVIVQSLADGKKFPAYASNKISALEDISIYTYEGDEPLSQVYQAIFDKTNGEAGPSHKDSMSDLTSFLRDVLPEYDEERVYNSDIKKLFRISNGQVLEHKTDSYTDTKKMLVSVQLSVSCLR